MFWGNFSNKKCHQAIISSPFNKSGGANDLLTVIFPKIPCPLLHEIRKIMANSRGRSSSETTSQLILDELVINLRIS